MNIIPTNAWLVDKDDGTIELMVEGSYGDIDITACIARTGGGISIYTRVSLEEMLAQIQEEITKVKVKAVSAFKCEKCGEEAYFSGLFTPARFERQLAEFNKKHANCPSLYQGGGI